jgi:NADPH:quinone reductase
MMLAAYYTEPGPAQAVLKVGEQPTPLPAPGEVLVRVRTSGVNPSDWKSRKFGFRIPTGQVTIPHSDGAGIIESVGAGVPAARVGERVWIWNGQWKRASGTAAEYIALPSTQAVTMPDSLDYAAGACLGIPALTALQAVRLANVGAGDTVLVAGGAGGVGHYAIQFAKFRNLRVLATVSTAEKAQHAQHAGADAVINYREEDVGARVRALTDGRGVDAILEVDLTANAKLIPDVLRPHGTVVVYGVGGADNTIPARWMLSNSASVKFFLIYDLTDADRTAVLAEINPLLQENRLKHEIGLRLPLSEVAVAHDTVENGSVIGHVVLDIADQ